MKETASRVFIPMTVGGGIHTLDDFDRVLKCGADKVSINSGAIRNPSLVEEAAKYGSQCVVLSVDIKRVDGKFTVFAKGAEKTPEWMRSIGLHTAWNPEPGNRCEFHRYRWCTTGI